MKNPLTVPEFISVSALYSYNLASIEQAPWKPSEVKYLYLDLYLPITQYPHPLHFEHWLWFALM